MNNYKKGQTLTDKDGNKRKVLEVLGDLVFISLKCDYEKSGSCPVQHYKEIDQKNYTVEQEKWVPEIDENYWFTRLDEEDKVDWKVWYGNDNDKYRLALNLVFKTKEEALARYEEILLAIKK